MFVVSFKLKKKGTRLVKHVQDSNHNVDWDNCKILHFETDLLNSDF